MTTCTVEKHSAAPLSRAEWARQTILQENDPSRRHAPKRDKTCTILIIDDSPAIVEALSDVVAHLGFRPIAGLNGQEGLRLLQSNEEDIAIVFLDMNMPVMDGAQTLQQLRRTHPTLPVVVATSMKQPDAHRRCRQAGATFDHYLHKPFTLEEAESLVHSILAVAPS